MKQRNNATPYKGRYRVMQVMMALVALVVSGRVAILHVYESPFLQNEGDKRTERQVVIPAHRGMIFDRNGSPLAVSSSVISVAANPQLLQGHKQRWSELARALGLKPKALRGRLQSSRNKGFLYLKRRMKPANAEKALALKIPGVYGLPEYKRFYPAKEITAQLVGMTTVEDRGQEGVELALDDWLAGSPGEREVTKDRKGHVIRMGEVLESAQPGKEVRLSIDLRLQWLAYRELQRAVIANKAKSGSLVMLDVKTGEVLAMVNQPSFNPNNREGLNLSGVRNRAITDQLEPGSVIKPFTVAAALESGRYNSHTPVKTSPGTMRLGRDMVKDVRNFGDLDVTGIITKSSNVGVSRLALDIGPEAVVSMFQRVGLGQSTGVVFPGERTGILPVRQRWRPIETATLSFGYGLTVTPLQLAHAYSVLANKGLSLPITILRREMPPQGEQVMDSKIATQVMAMMKTTTSRIGTARRAKVAGYSVAGKTGTVKKLGTDGYSDDSYISLFAGVVPADDPRVAVVVIIDGASSGAFYGGVVAAPVFSRVAGETMRVLGVPPEGVERQRVVADAARQSRNEG